jgi:hypothetical protein
MGRLPRGVAMGVSGEAQTQAEQPTGQVPFTGVVHPNLSWGPGTLQQSWPALQHSVLQQNWDALHVVPLHGGSPQVPLLQYGWVPVHVVPHAPQFLMSFFALTHVFPQHMNPGMEQAPVQVPPELLLDALVVEELLVVDELLLVDEPVVEELVVEELVVEELVVEELVVVEPVLVEPVWVELVVPLVVVPWPPAPPVPAVTLAPQPASAMVPIPKAKSVLMPGSYPKATVLVIRRVGAPRAGSFGCHKNAQRPAMLGAVFVDR